MKKGLFLVILVIVGFIIFLSQNKLSKEENFQTFPTVTQAEIVDYKASFAIYTNGTLRVFTASKYHNLSKDVFLTADDPNVIHIKKKGITWGDFFKTLPMKVTDDCLTTGTGQLFCTGSNGTLKFYLNSKRVENLLEREIKEGDKVLISFGRNDLNIEKEIQSIPDTVEK